MTARQGLFFTSYAAGPKCWSRAFVRLKNEIQKSIPSAEFLTPDEDSISNILQDVGIDFQSFSSENPRGNGLWLWKPALILSSMNILKEGDHLFYLDAGCTLNASEPALLKLEEYRNFIDENNFLFFQLEHKEIEWTKSALVAELSLKQDELNSGQIMATAFGASVGEKSEFFFREWLTLASQNQGQFLRDPTDQGDESSDFKAHRHDQSILSCLVKKRGFSFIQDETYFEPNWATAGLNFPIWATRKCSGLSKNFGFGQFSKTFVAVERKISKFKHQQTTARQAFE